MSDQTDTTVEAPEASAPTSADSPVAQTITQPGVTAPANALIGDENQPAPRAVEVHVVDEPVPAQVAAPETVAVTEVYVHETSVRMDEPILDPSSPEAVQIPDAGRGTLDLPIHALSNPTPEAFFAEHAPPVAD